MGTGKASASQAASAGFSIIESLLAVALLATLLGLAFPIWDGAIRDRNVMRAADDITGLLRYAQQAAVADAADACAYRVVVLSTKAQAVKVARDPSTGACASPESLTMVRVTDAFAGGTSATPLTVEFASTGALTTCGSAAVQITVSSSSRSKTIRVEPCSGAAEVMP